MSWKQGGDKDQSIYGCDMRHSSDVRQTMPHVVKFSGGRSSGMVLMRMLQRGQLDPKRGDVIVFNNTSAEHSATYDFTLKMKNLAEGTYNIPFFWIEYQTYEDACRMHQWARRPTYRLVNGKPYNQSNKQGYRYKGEVFEELMSLSGFVPNRYSRICTLWMKIFTTNSFLSDWFAQKESIERLGHDGHQPGMTDDDMIKSHRRHNGNTPHDILLAKRKFVRQCAFVREAQLWRDYTSADIAINNDILRESVLGDQAQLHGDWAIDYVSVLGIRADERLRISRIQQRIAEAQVKGGQSLSCQPPGEHILAPLIDDDVTQERVIEFWDKQDINLELPNNGIFSNCVYCPLKDHRKLLKIAIEQNKEDGSKRELTPESIDWWIEMERKYSRDIKAEKREVTSEKSPRYIGFFGPVRDFVFPWIKQKAKSGVSVSDDSISTDDTTPCHCTD